MQMYIFENRSIVKNVKNFHHESHMEFNKNKVYCKNIAIMPIMFNKALKTNHYSRVVTSRNSLNGRTP